MYWIGRSQGYALPYIEGILRQHEDTEQKPSKLACTGVLTLFPPPHHIPAHMQCRGTNIGCRACQASTLTSELLPQRVTSLGYQTRKVLQYQTLARYLQVSAGGIWR